MNFKKLKYFITVADEQNITKAAKKLYIAQPSLSQCIRSIEEEMGIELFTRGKSSVTMTPAGKIYYRWAKLTLESVRCLENDLAEVKSGVIRQIDVGATWQRSSFLLPESIIDFYKRCPECNVVIHESLDRKLHEMLERNELDLIIASPSVNLNNYNSVPLIQERLLLAAGNDFILEHKDGFPFPSVSRESLVGKPIVMLQERQNIGMIFRKILMDINYTPKRFTECVNLETAHRLVRNNVGLALLPEIGVVEGRFPDVNYYMIEDEYCFRNISAVYRKGHVMEAEILELIACLQRFLKNYNHPFIVKF